MNPQELRIGNLVNRLGGLTSITVISADHVSTLLSGAVTINQIEPIPLTEEWVVKLGFEKCNDLDCWYKIIIRNEWTRLNINIKHEMAEINVNRHCCVLGAMKYVHQLQNLYFALTDKELEYNGI